MKILPDSQKMLSIQEAAKMLGVSIDTLRRWDAAGRLKAHRTDGQQRRYTLEQLLQFRKKKRRVAEEQGSEIPSAKDETTTSIPSVEVSPTEEEQPYVRQDSNVAVQQFNNAPVVSVDLESSVRDDNSQTISNNTEIEQKNSFFSRARANNRRIYTSAAVTGFLTLVIFGLLSLLPIGSLPFFHSFQTKPAVTGGTLKGEGQQFQEVLAGEAKDFQLTVNIPALFTNSVNLKKGLEVSGIATLSGGLVTNNQNGDFGTGIVIASNIPTVILDGVTAGSGISVTNTDPTSPTISNTGVLSLQGSTGALSLVAGSGISISGLTISNTGSTTSVDSFANISVSGQSTLTAGSATDTLTFVAGSNITLTTDTANKSLTIQSSGASSQWTTNGTSIYYNGGNVGIGTTAPTQLFEIAGGAGIVAQFSGRVIGGDAINSNEFATLSQVSSLSGAYWQRNLGTLSPTNISDDVLVGGASTSSAKIRLAGTTNATSFFNTGGSLGIGTTSPISGYKTDIAADVTWPNDVTAGQLVLSGASNRNKRLSLGYDTTNSIGFIAAAEQGTSWSSLAIQPDGGFVGLGTTAPARKLDVISSGAWQAGLFSSGGGSPRVVLGTLDGEGTIGVNNAALDAWDTLYLNTNPLNFSDSGTSVFGGNVGIKTANPDDAFEVAGVDNLGIRISNAGNEADDFSALRFYQDGDEKAVLYTNQEDLFIRRGTGSSNGDIIIADSGGNVGIGTAGPEALLSVLGDFTSNTDIGTSIRGENSGSYLSLVQTAVWAWGIGMDQGSTSLNFVADMYPGHPGSTKMTLDQNGNLGISTTTPNSFRLEVAGNVGPEASGTRDLGSPSRVWNNVYANNFIGGTSGISGYWQRQSNAISPTNITDDVLVGGISTSSAKIRLGGTTNANSFFNTGGNVGIGTTTPLGKLSISGATTTAQGQSLVQINQTGTADILTASVSGSSKFLIDSFGQALGSHFSAGYGLAANSSIGIGWNRNVGNGTIIDSSRYAFQWTRPTNADYLKLQVFQGNGTEVTDRAIVVDADGQVGIGITNPDRNLYVYGSNASLAIHDSNGGGKKYVLTNLDTGDGSLGLYDETGTAFRWLVDTNGYMGIGTTDPFTRLEVSGGTTVGNDQITAMFTSTAEDRNLIAFNNNNGDTSTSSLFLYQKDGSNKWSMGNDLNNNATQNFFISDEVAGEIRFFMNSDGNVGLGNTDPSTFKLQTAGSIGPNADDTFDLGSDALRWRDLYLGSDTLHIGTSTSDEYTMSYNTASNYLGFNVNGSGDPEIVMNSSGNLGLGTTAPSTFKLEVAGDIGPDTTGRNFGSAAKPWNSIYTNSIVAGSTGTQGYWQRNSNALSPANITDDILLGGIATSSALVRLGGTTNAHSIFNSGGNVGIGNTNPTVKLFVDGLGFDQAVFRAATGASRAEIVIDNQAGGLQSALAFNDAGTAKWQIGKQGDNSFFIWDSVNALNRFHISTAGVVLLQPTMGNVGIGVSANSPTALLHVAGTTTGNAVLIADQRTANADIFTASASGTTRFVINNGGNVGIGTNAPATKLEIASGDILLGNNQSLRGRQTGGTSSHLASVNTSNQGVFGLNNELITAGDLITIGANTGILALNLATGNTNDNLVAITAGGSLSVTKHATVSGSLSVGTYNAPAQVGHALFSGNVGIGTTSPGALLGVGTSCGSTGRQIHTSSWADMSSNCSGYGVFGGNVYTNSAASTYHYSITHANIGAIGMFVNYPSWNQLSIGSSNTTSSTAGSAFTPSIIATFDYAGNVGIGTTVPVGKLNISGTANQKALGIIEGDGNQDLLTASVSGTTKFLLQKDGNVGIGSMTLTAQYPDFLLTLIASNSHRGQLNLRSNREAIDAGDILGGINFSTNDSGLTNPGFPTASISAQATASHTVNQFATALVFSTSNGTQNLAERMRIAADGNVGIGTTNPGEKVNVSSGSVKISNNAANGFFFIDDLFEAVGATGLCGGATGNIGTCTSDARLKTNINYIPLSEGLDAVRQLKPATFDWKDSKYGGAEQVGFIAQDVLAVIPEAVQMGQDGYYTFTNDKLVPHLTLAVQQLDQQIQGLSGNVQASSQFELVTRVDNLTTKVSDLEQLAAQTASDAAFLRSIMEGGQVLGASTSGSLTQAIENLDVNSNATIGNDLTVLGRTTVSDIGITGSLTAGVLSIDGLNGSLNTVGEPLKIQSLAVENVEFMAGKVVIKTDGSIISKGEVTAKKINIDESDEESKAVGEVIIRAGDSSAEVHTTALTENSRIFATPDEPVALGSKATGAASFRVTLSEPAERDVRVNWWVVN